MNHTSYGMQLQGAGAAVAAEQYAKQAYAQAQGKDFSPDQKPRESEAIFNQIADQLMRMGAQLERLHGLTNRTVGPRPEPVPQTGHGVPAGIPQALSGRLNMVIDALNIANQRLADDLNRLDQFV